MKRIPLTQGKFALVDDEDYELLSKYKWHAKKSGKNYYALSGLIMHRLIMPGKEIDHKNGDGLDNRKENLRSCTHQQNHQNNSPRKNSSSKYKGVSWHNGHNNWQCRIMLSGKRIHLGCFKSEKSAAIQYNNAAKKLFGEYARLNIV